MSAGRHCIPPPPPEEEPEPVRVPALDADTRAWRDVLDTQRETWRPEWRGGDLPGGREVA